MDCDFVLYNISKKEFIFFGKITELDGSIFMKFFYRTIKYGWNFNDLVVTNQQVLKEGIDVQEFTEIFEENEYLAQIQKKKLQIDELKKCLINVQRILSDMTKELDKEVLNYTRQLYINCTHKFVYNSDEPFDSICKMSCENCGMCSNEERHKHILYN